MLFISNGNVTATAKTVRMEIGNPKKKMFYKNKILNTKEQFSFK